MAGGKLKAEERTRKYMWQSRIKIQYYSVTHYEHITVSKRCASANGGAQSASYSNTSVTHASKRCVWASPEADSALVRIYCNHMHTPTQLGLEETPVWAMAFFSTCSTTLSCVAFRILTASSRVMSTIGCPSTWYGGKRRMFVSMKSAYSANSS